MPVAVHLIEILTLITILGLLTGCSIFIVVLQRSIYVILILLNPLTNFIGGLLYTLEKALLNVMMTILNLTT